MSMDVLDLHNLAQVENWLDRFELFAETKEKITEENMVAHFLTAAGKDTYALVKTLVFPQKPTDKSYNELKQALLQHLLPTNFQATERAAFHSLVRASNESIRNFILKIQQQAARCNFCDL